MKLKSLLLGSAAVLALSTGAQAADPIVEFVSLGVCDALGMSGLTIESDDTCLLVSGSVDYTFETGSVLDDFYTDSEVEWSLLFEAATQTDGGPARAVLRLNDNPSADNHQDLRIERAYVQFGDTTVLTAGLAGSIFDTEILDRRYGWLNFDEVDNGYLNNDVSTGGESIQIEALIADGFTVLAALENLQVDSPWADATTAADSEQGTAGFGVAYNGAGISGEVGVLLGDIFGDAEDVNYYARVNAEFDAFVIRAGILADDTGDWIASLGATATFDMFSLSGDAMFAEDDEVALGLQGSFAATDAIDAYVGVAYSDRGDRTVGDRLLSANYGKIEIDDAYAGEVFAVYGGVNFDVTETITANAELGYVDLSSAPGFSATDLVYGAAGVTYAPGGNFETGLEVYLDTEESYAVTFSASKSF